MPIQWIFLDQLSIDDLQAFFKSSYQCIFYLFFENFSQVESNITRARMSSIEFRDWREFLDLILVSKQNQNELEYVTNLLEVNNLGSNWLII